jgi:hypothetical protein
MANQNMGGSTGFVRRIWAGFSMRLCAALRLGLLGSVVLVAPGSAAVAQPTEMPSVRVGPKPADSVVERRARRQPGVPEGVKEVPYVEAAPEPSLTEIETERGYMLFQRPLTESVYPNTRPLTDERLEGLVAFAAPGEFEPVTFAMYPVRPLKNLKVRVSALVSGADSIPAGRVDVRLATYWNVGYPAYTTVKTYRRVPELLERVTVHSSPAGECQRYWLTVHVPADARAGLYLGTVTLWDEGCWVSRCRKIPASTFRHITTCGTERFTVAGTRRSSGRRPIGTIRRCWILVWTCCRRFTWG